MSGINLRRFWRAFVITALLVGPSAAYADSNIPPSLNGLKVFNSGTAPLAQLHFAKVNVKPRVGTATVFDKVSGNKYVITAHTPVVPGVISFMYSSYAGGQLLVMPWGPDQHVAMNGSDDLKTAPWTSIVLNATAGKAYLIDVNMWASAASGSNGNCAIDIAGPDGSDQKSSCATDYNSQDIAFIYKANKTNIEGFQISILGSQASAIIYSATMAVLP